MCSKTQQIFDAFLEKIVENDNKMSTEVIENLFSLFEMDFIESIQLIDEKSVSLLRSQSNRQVFEVEVKDNKAKTTPNKHFCVIDANYCSCGQFRRGVLNDSVLFCHHLIASKLSNAMKCFKTVDKTDEDIDRLWIKHIIN